MTSTTAPTQPFPTTTVITPTGPIDMTSATATDDPSDELVHFLASGLSSTNINLLIDHAAECTRLGHGSPELDLVAAALHRVRGTARQLIASLKPQETDMTTTDQPADLDRLRRALAIYDHTGRDHDAHELAAEIPALIAEIERLRAVTENLLNQLGDAADKLLALGWDDVANQMEAGTYRPANLA